MASSQDNFASNLMKGLLAVGGGLLTGTVLAAHKKKVPVLRMVSERLLLEKLTKDEEPSAPIDHPSRSELDFAFDILGLSKIATLSRADVREAARRFLLENHPDKFASLGKSTEALATLLCQWANWAADTISNTLPA